MHVGGRQWAALINMNINSAMVVQAYYINICLH